MILCVDKCAFSTMLLSGNWLNQGRRDSTTKVVNGRQDNLLSKVPYVV